MVYSKFNIGFVISLSLALFSCNTSGNSKGENTTADTTKTQNESLNKLTAVFKKELTLPLSVDSAFLAQEHFGDSLGASEIQILAAASFKSAEGGGMDYELREFYKIDSIKASGTYAKWCETLDIGMTKYANAYAIGKVTVNGTTPLLVWAFTRSSYEACPWSSGISIYFTFLKSNGIGESFLLGESYGAGDAPVSMHREIYGKLNSDGHISITSNEENDDADATESEVTKGHSDYIIKNDKVELIKEDKGKPVKVPHPPVSE